MRPNKGVRDANAEIEQKWLNKVADYVEHGDRSKIEQIASQHHGGQTCELIQQIHGAFNYCFKIRFGDNKDWLLRFPKPGCSMSPTAKVNNEFAVMRFISQNTTIPIPRAIACGMAQNEISWLGPYILMEFVEGESLNEVILDDDDNIKCDVSETALKHIYRQVANIFLQLNAHVFDQIGSLSIEGREDKPLWRVEHGPMTLKSNEIERMGGVTTDHLVGHSFEDATSYLDALGEQSLHYLHENPVASKSAEEASIDYKAIHTLKSAIVMPAALHAVQKHRLFNDDLRFGNILVHKGTLDICSVIDWEFCYAAPAAFAQSPPWWIIGKEPFEWDAEDTDKYSKMLELMLDCLREEEERGGYDNTFSTMMQKYWDDGTFWLGVGLRECRFLNEVMKHTQNMGRFAGERYTEAADNFGRRKMEQWS